MNRHLVTLVLPLAAASAPAIVGAQDTPTAGPSVISAAPAEPKQGTLFRVTYRPKHPVDSGVEIRGKAGDQPLHFDRDPAGGFTALAPMPIAAKELTVEAWMVHGGEAMGRAEMSLTATPGDYPSEKLTVAPRYGAEPDAATRARMARDSAKADSVGKGAQETPRLWEGPFIAPRPGRVTSSFGMERLFNGAVTSRHMGTDFAGAVGAPVQASNRGVVRIVDRFHIGGNVVYVDHGEGLVTAYLHLSEQNVAVGDTVQKGQTIGKVGATGRVTGPHLHLIARYGTVTVDPLSLFQITGNEEGVANGK